MVMSNHASHFIYPIIGQSFSTSPGKSVFSKLCSFTEFVQQKMRLFCYDRYMKILSEGMEPLT